jgi:Entner-Doudoroff aldolase
MSSAASIEPRFDPHDAVAERIREGGIIAMIRGDFPVAHMLAIGETLADASISIIEVTFNSANALEAIAALGERLADRALIGAGTVRSPEDVDRALAAGARFAVSPILDEGTLARAGARGLFYMPGVMTPTEAAAANRAGVRMLKLFPSDLLGPRYLRALRAPLDELEFVPTGGVSADNVGDYAAAGAVAVGVGSALVAGPDQPLADVARRARALRRAWREAR